MEGGIARWRGSTVKGRSALREGAPWRGREKGTTDGRQGPAKGTGDCYGQQQWVTSDSDGRRGMGNGQRAKGNGQRLAWVGHIQVESVQ